MQGRRGDRAGSAATTGHQVAPSGRVGRPPKHRRDSKTRQPGKPGIPMEFENTYGKPGKPMELCIYLWNFWMDVLFNQFI